MIHYFAKMDQENSSIENSDTGNIIQFPRKNSHRRNDTSVIEDPCITVTDEFGRHLDRLGMSGDECCYILLPASQTLLFEFPQLPVVDADGRPIPCVAIRKIVLSEPEAVTEIDCLPGSSTGSSAESACGMYWIERGKQLHLHRHSPDQVALLALKLELVHG